MQMYASAGPYGASAASYAQANTAAGAGSFPRDGKYQDSGKNSGQNSSSPTPTVGAAQRGAAAGAASLAYMNPQMGPYGMSPYYQNLAGYPPYMAQYAGAPFQMPHTAARGGPFKGAAAGAYMYGGAGYVYLRVNWSIGCRVDCICVLACLAPCGQFQGSGHCLPCVFRWFVPHSFHSASQVC